MCILKIIGFIMAAVIFVIVVGILIVITQYLLGFYLRSCKHCGHTMQYKGLKEDGDKGYHLFHCPRCGAWEQVTKDNFLDSMDKNPYDQ